MGTTPHYLRCRFPWITSGKPIHVPAVRTIVCMIRVTHIYTLRTLLAGLAPLALANSPVRGKVSVTEPSNAVKRRYG